MNKKGAEMTVGTIVIIILALVVLVVLVMGFTTGWGNLWQKMTGFGGGDDNVQTVIQSCQIACAEGSQYDFCDLKRNVVEGGEKSEQKCSDLIGKGGLKCDAIVCP
ncbi:hypothetical protein HOE04_05575 [archaeon]|jgi:hypothetical protein|nr:hypothetical protein [archaeon]